VEVNSTPNSPINSPLPTPHSQLSRSHAVSTVLYRVLFLNLIVAAAKIALGLATGAVSVLSDGYHSLTDTASNIVGIIGVRIAGEPPDDDHPYGHRKFETMASVGILIFLLLVLREVLSAAWERLQTGGQPTIGALTFLVMGGTFLVNLWVVFYERRAGKRLDSEVLLADAHHTTSDLMTSATVIVALIGVKLGYLWLDPIAALVVAAFIGYACWEIFKQSSGILADRFVIPEETIRDVVRSVPEVIGCHHIRTRGSADFVFLDLHIWMDADMSLTKAHSLSHVVKDRLMVRFPQIKDAIIHIEPPPKGRNKE
jgi:cation diffusion facilitator family transporter